jgi:hemerythrin-like metal-binding protein
MRSSLTYTPLGHSDIDKDHQEIVYQINEINKLISKRTEDETILKLIDLLIARSVQHYSNEERLMDLVEDYPDKELHILEHRLVIQSMTHYRHKLQQEIIEYQLAFKKSISMWLDHMFKYDKTLVDQYNKEFQIEDTEDE